jgi:long-chain fatty acid transport protein
MPKRQRKAQLLTLAVASALASGSALATNGYALHGIGMHAKGMGGASIALPQDSVSMGQNPAASAVLGNRADVGIDIFRPMRSTTISDTGGVLGIPRGALDGNFDGSESEWFFIPEGGYNRVIDSKWSAGVALFGNGGMNTDYGDGIPLFNSNLLAGTSYGGDTGINLQQMFIVPTVAYKINDQHAIGLGANIVAQGFKAWGLGTFDNQLFSNSAGNVAGNGTDWAWGLGFRLGWLGQITNTVSMGAYYSSRTWMQEFEDYAGLFAEEGSFDIPENFGIGIAIKATPQLTIAADIVRINYSTVDSIANSVYNFYTCPTLYSLATNSLGGSSDFCLGGSSGPGFGWEDQTIFKLGVQYVVNSDWTVRAGWNYAKQPIPEDETLFNSLAPGVVEHHLTLGASWNLAKNQEVTFAYMHAFEKEVNGEYTAAFGTADIKMYQDSFGVQYSWKM